MRPFWLLDGRLARLLEAAAVGGEQPAVIAAPDPVLLDATVLERGAAMRAVRVEHPDAPALIAERDQFLAQDPHELGQLVDIGREAHRLPVAPQQLSHRRSQCHVSEFHVFLWHLRDAAVA